MPGTDRWLGAAAHGSASFPLRGRAYAWLALLRLLHLEHEAGDGLITGDEELVRGSGGNMDDFARAQLLVMAAVDGVAAGFSGSNDPRAHDRAAGDQRGRAREDQKKVGPMVMDFDFAVAAAEGEHDAVPRVFAQGFAGLAVAGAGQLAQVGSALEQDGLRPVVSVGRVDLLVACWFRCGLVAGDGTQNLRGDFIDFHGGFLQIEQIEPAVRRLKPALRRPILVVRSLRVRERGGRL